MDGEHDSVHDAADESSFCARMKAQCQEIEAYRLHVMRSESRTLTLEQAAQEWIERHAKNFSARWRDH